ncbi:MAG TPA: glycosyltransferase family 39 protein, partial [Anaerolineae bacterium]|nr:glycosyltransferase family 39 protein [Anaerolineae bacterium]
MPLPSILVAASESIFGVSYRAAQLPFILLSAFLPLITFAVAWRITHSRRAAWIGALLTIFSGFYLPYWGVPESFAPFAVFGSLAIYLSVNPSPRWKLLMAGACAGLAHLSRADGVLLLLPMLLVQVRTAGRGVKEENVRRKFPPYYSAFSLIIAGYLLIMSPWFIRNIMTIGAPLSPAGTQAAYICNYDELFSYGMPLNFQHLIDCGVGQVVGDKLRALASGLV